MSRLLHKAKLAPETYELTIESPRIARKAHPGQFVIVMADEHGERIPLTIADFDRQRGTITLVEMVVGTSTQKLSRIEVGDSLYVLVGPLGHASELGEVGTVVMVAGGVGTAPVYPIARGFHELGCRVLAIQGARNVRLLFWVERMRAVSDEHIITTDDGSAGRKGLVTDPLRELLEDDTTKSIDCVYAIGPAVMMKFCSLTTQPFGVKTIVSLNSLMVDGTGMCGGCRVQVGGKTRFTCVEGPEFDGHLVDWDLLLFRQNIYTDQERYSLEHYLLESRRT
jgi:ferredoxin--NADP+ reductase